MRYPEPFVHFVIYFNCFPFSAQPNIVILHTSNYQWKEFKNYIIALPSAPVVWLSKLE